MRDPGVFLGGSDDSPLFPNGPREFDRSTYLFGMDYSEREFFLTFPHCEPSLMFTYYILYKTRKFLVSNGLVG